MVLSGNGSGRRAVSARVGAVLAAAVLVLSLSCAAKTPDAPPPGRARIPDVPFFPQEDFQCGPASLAGVLAFHGLDASPEALALEVFRPDIRGTLGLDMALAARKRGLSARFYEGSATDLAQGLSRGLPLVLLLDLGLGPVHRLHFVVATGFGPEGVILNSDQDQGRTVAWPAFLAQWNKTGRWTLWIER